MLRRSPIKASSAAGSNSGFAAFFRGLVISPSDWLEYDLTHRIPYTPGGIARARHFDVSPLGPRPSGLPR